MLIDDRVVEILLLCEMVLLCLLARPGVRGAWKLLVEEETVREEREMLLLGVAILDMERLRAMISEFFFVCEGDRWGILGASASAGVAGK
jgi:hypothetical protein